MIKEKILEGNKLIAEFMEFDVKNSVELFIPEHERHVEFKTTNGTFVSAIFKFNELNYHSSWDWLMPCIGKISNACEELEELDELKYALLCNDIETAWEFVVEFIKWYNQNKND